MSSYRDWRLAGRLAWINGVDALDSDDQAHFGPDCVGPSKCGTPLPRWFGG